MIYHHLLARADRKTPVNVALIGAGFFGASVAAQSGSIPMLDIAAIADRDLEAGRRAFHRAGVSDEQIAVCESRESAMVAAEKGKRVLTEDAMLAMELPQVDIVVEATGSPEAGATHGLAAIRASTLSPLPYADTRTSPERTQAAARCRSWGDDLDKYGGA